MNNRMTFFDRFFSQKKLFSPPRLMLFLTLLLWGLVPNRALAKTIDPDLNGGDIKVEWFQGRAAFKVNVTVYDPRGALEYDEWFGYVNFYMDGRHCVTVYGDRDDENMARIETHQTTDVCQVFKEKAWQEIPYGGGRIKHGYKDIEFWIYPTNPERSLGINVKYKTYRKDGNSYTSSTYSECAAKQQALYDYGVNFTPTFTSKGATELDLSVNNLNKHDYKPEITTTSNVYIQTSKDDGKSYSDYNYTVPTLNGGGNSYEESVSGFAGYHAGSELSCQEFANGMWVRVKAETDPDSNAGKYEAVDYSKAYHTGATQVFDDKYLTVEQKNAVIVLNWKVLQPEGNEADKQHMGDYEVQRYVNGEWTLVETVPCNTSLTSYSYNYVIPEDEREKEDENGDVVYKFRVWKKCFESEGIWHQYMLSDEVEETIHTNYKKITVETVDPDETTKETILKWSLSDNGVWDEDVEQIIQITNVTNGGVVEYKASYSDLSTSLQQLAGCTKYTVVMKVKVGGVVISTSNEIEFTTPSEGERAIVDFRASKGYYNNYVRLEWQVPADKSDFKRFNITRKAVNSSTVTTVAQINHTGLTDYSYQDNGMDAGILYEYTIIGYSACSDAGIEDEGQDASAASKTSIGFSQPYATVSGRIAYNGSQGVEGVAVSAIADGDVASNKSLYFTGSDSTSNVSMSSKLIDFTQSKAYTLQFWVNPSEQIASEVYLFSKNATFDVKLIDGKVQLYTLGKSMTTSSSLPQDTWTHVTVSTTLGSDQTTTNMKLYLNGIETGDYTLEGLNTDSVSMEHCKSSPFIMAGCSDGTKGFKGYMDEVRIYNTELDSATIAKNYNIFLSGKESNLMAYYRCDEVGSRELFDLSATGSDFHMLDGAIGSMASHSINVPSADQLSIRAYTDADGNYLLNTIPYTSDGVQYNLVPTLGIHKFSPNKRPIYASPSSTTFNGIDFDDTSSFPVSGTVYYEGTEVPVEGAELSIDGIVCSFEGEIITTDEKGNFAISVPIGSHHISVKKNGHTFVNNGRYPADANNVGTKVNFDQSVAGLNFYDNTLVNIAGRVVGGAIEADKPLGLKQSKNNIGSATLKLSYGKYMLNSIIEVSGTSSSVEPNPDDVVVASATSNIQSTSYRAGGSGEEARYIYITTDPETGEYSAMVPPLIYEINEVVVPTTEVTDMFDKESLPSTIDASSPTLEHTDSIVAEDGEIERFKYGVSQIFSYRSNPQFSVTDQSNTDGAFGVLNVKYSDLTTESVDVPMYEVTTDSIDYLFDYPVFVKGYTYNFDLFGYEEYINNDGEESLVDRVPLENTVVTITNMMSDGRSVYVQSGTTSEGQNVEVGDLANLESNQIALDSLGKAVYTWNAGYPNITAPYTLGLEMVYEVAEKEYTWDGGFSGIVFGEMPSGNNFVTSGPDEVLMILRDPAGSNSSAFWEEGQSITKETMNSGSGFIGSEISTIVSLGTEQNVIAGTPLTGTINTIGAKVDMEVGVNLSSTVSGGGISSTTTTTTKRISTSDNEDYVGAVGDVFIGTATNIIFGNARNVGLKKDAGTGGYSIEKKDVITTGSEFGTAFNYTQYYIEEVLIPNLYLNRNALLQTVPAAQLGSITNNGEDLIYVTSLSSDDERFGSNNTDEEVWGNQATASASTMEGPSYRIVKPSTIKGSGYQDKVLWYNTQIEMWTNALAENEQVKVKAKESREKYLAENLSFDQGVAIESSTETCEAETTYQEWEFETMAIVGVESGFDINGTGVAVNAHHQAGASYAGSNTDGKETCSTTGYTLQDDGYNDALSVDVFRAPDGYGAVFSTRGGQTSCPYEGATLTKYYKPGTEISAATMQIEIPVIESDVYNATDIPAGGTAVYNLELRNDSETGDDIWFNLKVVDATNPNGASLSVDGSKLTESGRGMLVPTGGKLKKTLQLTQTQKDVLEYDDIALVLVSQCQSDPTGIHDVIADTIYIGAQFVPACSDITLDIPETTMNMFTSDILTLNMKDFDRNYNTFTSIRLQYKYANDVDWKLGKEYVLDEADVTSSKELLPAGNPVTVQFPMSNSALFPDGVYQFRLQTACEFGVEGVYTESEVVTVTKDMSAPQVLGTPNPSDGILSAGDDISIIFNENIRSGALTNTSNFIVTGELNGARIDHEVALRLDGATHFAAETEADVHLANSSFALDFWVNYTGSGTLVQHGSGTNKFVAAIDDAGKLVVTIGNSVITSTESIPSDSWCFIAMNYDNTGTGCIFNALAANDASTISLFNAEKVPAYTGVGTLAVGKGLTGAMHEVALWNRARTLVEAQSEMYVTKAPSTLNLTGYWRLVEGHGSITRDAARNRHMTLVEDAWYLNNENLAAQLDGNSYLELNISTVSASSTESHMLEMWFKGAKNQTDATLFSVQDKLAVKFNSKGELVLLQEGVETLLSSTNYLDENWHHMALNALSTGFTSVYVDGVAVKQIASSLVSPIQGSALIIGAERFKNTSGEGGYLYESYFTGAVDEIRYWVSTLNAEYIKNNRYNRIDIADVAGLNAYYPFEKAGLDSGNQVAYTFDLADASANAVGEAAAVNVTEADNAPALQSAPELTNIQYSYVASEREIVISLLEEAARIEGTTVNFTVRNVRDENNNLMEAATWSAYVNNNRLVWGDSELAFEQHDGKQVTFTTTISNEGSEYENWMISNLPTWMSASATTGSLSPLEVQTITFTIDSDMPIGNYEEVLYLSGNDAIYVALPITLGVKAEAPSWSVNPADFENNQSVIGVLSILDEYSNDSEDIVAAFIGETCVGIESPVYNSRYDSYFVMMSIYGNKEQADKEIIFKVWDASTGLIHPVVTTSSELTFMANNIVGNFNTPFTWNAQNYMEQTIPVIAGWNWTSLGVAPTDSSVSNIFATIADNMTIAKHQDEFTLIDENDTWSGYLTEVVLGKMYQVQMQVPDEIVVTGAAVDIQSSPIRMNDTWNWIGYTPLFNLTVGDALADLNPETGDVIKSNTGFAMYQDYEWIGGLTTLKPGEGYMYMNASGEAKEFTYPSSATYTTESNVRKSQVLTRSTRASAFTPIDYHKYPNNMTMIAQLKDRGTLIYDAEVAVFAGDECRTVQSPTEEGWLYFTIPGDATTDLTFRVMYEGELYEIDQDLVYRTNDHYGYPSDPYVIELSGATSGIDHANGEAVNVYPNVTKGDVYVESNVNLVSIKVCNTIGAVLYETTTFEGRLDFSGYTSGLYFVVLVDENGNTYTKQVIKK